jgi:uncharacterized lipoprotein YehR (DUF1307 family)
MKKVALVLASLLVIMLAGCGEGSSSSGGVDPVVETPTGSNDALGGTQSSAQGDEVSAAVTTAVTRTPLQLSAGVGTPPSLPSN